MLNRETRPSHIAVENAFDAHDMGNREGLGRVVAAHLGALDCLMPSLADTPRYGEEIARLRRLAERSATALEAPAPRAVSNDIRFDPLAVAYVVLGSRLGAKIVTRRLDASGAGWNDDVRAYFADTGSGRAWRALCDEIDAISDADRLAAITEDARRVFALYEDHAQAFTGTRCTEPS